jgi:hypothetical protein
MILHSILFQTSRKSNPETNPDRGSILINGDSVREEKRFHQFNLDDVLTILADGLSPIRSNSVTFNWPIDIGTF